MSTMSQGESTAKRAPSRARVGQEDRIRIRAARLRVTTDKKLGKTTPEWVKDLAKRKL